MSDIGSVFTYASHGLRLWDLHKAPHGRICPCLICADTRKYLGLPPLVPTLAPARRQDKAW